MTDLHYTQRSHAAVDRLARALASESDRIFWETDKLKITADEIAQASSVPEAYDLAVRWFGAADDIHVRREGIGSLTHALGELIYAMSRDDAASEARDASHDEAALTAADSIDDLAGDLADFEDDTTESIDLRVCRATIASLEELLPRRQAHLAACRAAGQSDRELLPLADQVACITRQLHDERAALPILEAYEAGTTERERPSDLIDDGYGLRARGGLVYFA